MAYGGLQGQAPQGVAPINGLPTNDVRELTVRSGNNISAGDVVDVEGGEVFKSFVPTQLTPIPASGVGIVRCVLNNKFFITTAIDISNQQNISIKSYEYSIKNNYIKKVHEVSIQIGENSNWKSDVTGCVRANNTHAILSCGIGRNNSRNKYALIDIKVDESGNITYKKFIDYSNSTNRASGGLVNVSESQILHVTSGYEYGDYKIYGEFLNVTSDSVSYNNPVSVLNQNNTYLKVTNAPWLGYLLLFFTDNSSHNMRLCKIDSNKLTIVGSVVDYEQPLDLNWRVTGTMSENNDGAIIIHYKDNSSSYRIDAYLVDKSTGIKDSIQLSSFTTTGSVNASTILGNNYLLYYNDGNVVLESYESKKLTERDSVPVDSTYAQFLNSIDDKYGIINSNNIGRYFTIYNNKISGYLTNSSKDAIALQSGTSGQPISVGFGGYCPCDDVVEGQTITSSGVMGYGVQDGWLDVRPEYEKSYEFGSYIGNGKYGVDNPNTLTFSFAPSMVHLLFRTAPEAGTNAGKDENITGEGYNKEQKFMVANRLTTDYRQSEGFGFSSYSTYGKKSADGKTFYWYSADMTNQCNATGTEYYYIAFR